MEGFYPPNQLPPQELQRQLSQQPEDQQSAQRLSSVLPISASDPNAHAHIQLQLQQPRPPMPDQMVPDQTTLPGGHIDMQRRRSVPHAYGHPMTPIPQNQAPRRMSSIGPNDIMTFGGSNNELGNYQFNQQMPPPFSTINNNISMQDQMENYMADPTNFSTISPDMMGTMMSSQFANMDMGQMATEPSSMGMFPTTNGPVQNSVAAAMVGQYNPNQLAAVTNDFSIMNPDSTPLSDTPNNAPGGIRPVDDQDEDMMNVTPQAFAPVDPGAVPPPNNLNLDTSNGNFTPTRPPSTGMTQPSSSDATTPVTASTPREQSKEKTIYSKSGFDMLKALWLVATRKNPKINLGAVDMSCAFVVCDVTMNDCPIIYVSDNFQNLTGYSRHEIVGQNCRFLQAPDGKVEIDLVECPDAISGQEMGSVKVNYKHSDIGQYIWTPPSSSQWEPENGQTLGVDDVSTLLQQFNPNGLVSDWHKQSWDKMLLENTDDVVHVLSLKGLFLYLSPACKRVLEYDATDLVGNSLSSVCHPSDIVPVTRELKDATAGSQVNIVFRIRRKQSGYTWFESHGSLFIEQGKGRKCIILVGRKRPVFTLSRRNLEANGGIGDSELWTKLSTSGMFLSVSSNVRSLLDLQPESLVGTSIQDLMRKESRAEFGRTIEKARRGKIATCKHEVQNRRGQGLQAQTILYPGDAAEGQKPSFLLAQTKLLKASSRNIAPAIGPGNNKSIGTPGRADLYKQGSTPNTGQVSQPAGGALAPGTQDAALASEDNIFDELRTTKCSSWQFELRQMEKVNRILAEELGGLLSNKKKRKRRKGVGNVARDCANCHTRNTPEWRRGPSGQRDLCNSCGLRWAKQTGRVSPRNSTRGGNNGNGDSQSKKSASPIHSSPLHRSETPNPNGAVGNGEGSIDPAQLTNKMATALSGATSGLGQSPSSTMPPPSQSSLTVGAIGSGMASIREERETSQT
ncbi:White collar 1 protein [Cladobotryum mycophilum]|uniref:White collar 1 protein n=1 Tax=Cladobotryum mycophilum TaxID=491253 RepID=A0ABR0SLT2_9HYPO